MPPVLIPLHCTALQTLLASSILSQCFICLKANPIQGVVARPFSSSHLEIFPLWPTLCDLDLDPQTLAFSCFLGLLRATTSIFRLSSSIFPLISLFLSLSLSLSLSLGGSALGSPAIEQGRLSSHGGGRSATASVSLLHWQRRHIHWYLRWGRDLGFKGFWSVFIYIFFCLCLSENPIPQNLSLIFNQGLRGKSACE
jgi:hypothetical protein